MYTTERDHYRKTFYEAWQKYQKGVPLQALEIYIVEIILSHPDYQRFLVNEKQVIQQTFATEENPFFHMSLHIALKEQLQADKPQGIQQIFHDLKKSMQNEHDIQHAMMACMLDVLQASQFGFDDANYLSKLRLLCDVANQ